MRGLDDLVRAGKIVYAGVSDTPAWIVSAANTMADLRGWSPFVGLQIEYSLVERTPERDLLPMARQFDLGVLAWAPLAAGLLTGKYRSVDDGGTGIGRLSEGSPRLTERNLAIARTVTEVAGALGVSPARVAIAWLRTRPGVVIPMLGARTVEQIDDDLASLDITLEEEHLAKLDAASAIGPSFPMNFLSQEAVLDHVYGTERGRFDFHRGRP
jgi:aryl-alcohol dehydrogenase-like predicted oxidoreductase